MNKIMKTYNELVKASKSKVRDTDKIARLYTTCVSVYNMKLDIRDYMDPNKTPDLRVKTLKEWAQQRF